MQKSLSDLHKKFPPLVMELMESLKKKVEKNKRLIARISVWAQTYMKWKPDTIRNVDEIFQKIDPHYDFLDCKILIDLSEEFLKDVIIEENKLKYYLTDKLKSHYLKAKALCCSSKISDLKKSLENIYEPFETSSMKNMPIIRIQLQNNWNDINIEGLKLLIGKLLPIETRQSLIKYISIRSGSVFIEYKVTDCRGNSLARHIKKKLQFMRLIGIFSLHINDHTILQENENMNFTFKLALHEAVTAGHSEAVEFLLQLETVNIDHTNEAGKTALMLACERGYEDIVYSLLSAGANVNLQDNNGWTALMRASKHNHISNINMLLKANADPHLKTTLGSNALIIATINGCYKVAEILVIRVDPNVQNKNGWNALMAACQNGHTQIVKLLLKEQVDPNVQKKDGVNAFMLACHHGHIQIVELLLKEKIQLHLKNNDGLNAFMLACNNGHTQIVKLLLKKKVDVNNEDARNWNALMLACQNGHTQVVELLLKEQVDLNVKNEDGQTAFLLASACGHAQIVELLLEKANACWNDHGFSHPQIAGLLLEEEINVKVQDKDGYNALILACKHGHLDIVELLLKDGIDLDVQDDNGYTALMYASAEGHEKIVELLLDCDADPDIVADDTKIALDVAKTEEIWDIILQKRKRPLKRAQSFCSAKSGKSSGGCSTKCLR